MRNLSYLLCTIFVILSSCSEEIPMSELNLTGDVINYEIVVTGFISNEKERCRIRLSKPVPVSDSTELIPIDDATLVLKHGEDTYMFQYDSTGIYSTLDSIIGIAGDAYTLEMTYHGKTFTAKETIPYEPDDDFLYLPFTYESFGAHGGGMIIVRFHNFGYNKTNLWGYVEPIFNANSFPVISLYNVLSLSIYTFKGSIPQGIFQPKPTGFVLMYSAKDSIELIKAEISEGYNQYVLDKLNETDWQGSIFSTFPGNISTNLSDGAIGYFYALNVKRKRFLIGDLLDSK